LKLRLENSCPGPGAEAEAGVGLAAADAGLDPGADPAADVPVRGVPVDLSLMPEYGDTGAASASAVEVEVEAAEAAMVLLGEAGGVLTLRRDFCA
jgi:hypothetical protein